MTIIMTITVDVFFEILKKADFFPAMGDIIFFKLLLN